MSTVPEAAGGSPCGGWTSMAPSGYRPRRSRTAATAASASVPSVGHQVYPEVAICLVHLVQIARQEEQTPMTEVVGLVANTVLDVVVAPGDEETVQHAKRRASRDA